MSERERNYVVIRRRMSTQWPSAPPARHCTAALGTLLISDDRRSAAALFDRRQPIVSRPSQFSVRRHNFIPASHRLYVAISRAS